jgi:hypothetical protein
MNKLFQKLADRGHEITMLRNEYAAKGIFFTAHRIEIIIRFRKIKENFLKQ